MKNKIFSVIALLLVVFYSAQTTASKKNTSKEADKRLEDSVVEVSSVDVGMNEAMVKAKQNISQFEKALKDNNSEFKNFGVKIAFASDIGDEYLWISTIVYSKEKNVYAGIVNSNPMYTKLVKYDEIVEFKLEDVADWMYFKGNLLIGGYTIRVLRDRMSNKERENFDKESGYQFE